jgi:nucleotide-binding universal stress UspA family protein
LAFRFLEIFERCLDFTTKLICLKVPSSLFLHRSLKFGRKTVFRRILMPLANYPFPTLPGEIAVAVKVAELCDGALTGLQIVVDPPSSVGRTYAMPFIGTMIDAERAKAHANEIAVAIDFQSQAGKARLKCQLRNVRPSYFDPAIWAEAARYHDLTVLPLSEDDSVARSCAETVVFGSGRPCLIVPKNYSADAIGFKRAIIAWDGGPAAARSVADALPLLLHSEHVNIVTAAPDKEVPTTKRDELIQYLADHGIGAKYILVDTSDRSAVVAISDAICELNSDILVMGAFGHSYIRDFVLGGVTRQILNAPPIPIFMSH